MEKSKGLQENFFKRDEIFIEKSVGGALKLAESISKYLNFLELIESSSAHTLRAYKNDLKGVFSEELEKNQELPPASVLLEQARRAQRSWSKLAPASRNRKVACLKSYFGYLAREKIIDDDLATKLHSPRVPKKIPHFLSVDEIYAVLKKLREKREEKDEKTLLLFLLLYGGGLRVSEACQMCWNQISITEKIARLKGKGGKERIVAFPKVLCDQIVLLKQHTNVEGPYLWGAKPLNPRTAYEWIRQAGIDTGLIKSLHPHALRHSYATHLLSSGANLRTLQELLGHSTLTATEKYTHLGMDELARTLEKHHPMGRGK